MNSSYWLIALSFVIEIGEEIEMALYIRIIMSTSKSILKYMVGTNNWNGYLSMQPSIQVKKDISFLTRQKLLERSPKYYVCRQFKFQSLSTLLSCHIVVDVKMALNYSKTSKKLQETSRRRYYNASYCYVSTSW